MPPSLPIALQAWAKESIETRLCKAANSGGDCLPPEALQAALQLHETAVVQVPAYRKLVAEARQQQQEQEQAEQPPGGSAGSDAAAEGGECRASTPGASSQSEEDAAPCPAWDQVPFWTKEQYIQRYLLPERCTGGSLAAADFVHESSGSSGQPTLWARNCFDELAVCDRFEQLLWDNWQAHKRSTLAVVCLPLGCWVGGLFTSLCLRFLTLKGYKLTLVTPGNKVPEILQLVPALAPHYEQTVLFGYPPFIKGLVDAGIASGLPWADWNVKLVLAGEVFSEEWRSLMAQRLGVHDVLRDIVSLYGTADAGVIGNETPLSVAIRRWLAAHPEAAAGLFGAQRLPTLVQYDPFSRLLEKHPDDGTLVVSSIATPHTAAPLLRYCIGDAGGILSYSDMLGFLKQHGFEPPPGLPCRALPFAFVFGRSFWTVSVFGCNVYVENIMSGLEQPELADSTTGKFVLFVEESADLDRQLALRVELARGVQPSSQLEQQVAAVVLRELRRLNSAYGCYVPENKQAPIVRLHPYGDPDWFPLGVKHRWTA